MTTVARVERRIALVRRPRTLGWPPDQPLQRRRLGRTRCGALHDTGATTAPINRQRDDADATLRQRAHARRDGALQNVRSRLDRRPAGNMSRVRHLGATGFFTLHTPRSIKHTATPDVPHITQRRDVPADAALADGSLRTGQHDESFRHRLRPAHHRGRQQLRVLLGPTPQVRRARRD